MSRDELAARIRAELDDNRQLAVCGSVTVVMLDLADVEQLLADDDPSDTYQLLPYEGATQRVVVSCPSGGCPVDVIAGEQFPIALGRVRALAAAHEAEHLAAARG